MSPSIKHLRFVTPLAIGLGVVSLGWPAAVAGQSGAKAETAALQDVADVILIESACRAFAVDYGALFAFAERNGIASVDIMPTGARRAAFDAAYRRRARELKGAELCGAFAAERAAAIPGVFTRR